MDANLSIPMLLLMGQQRDCIIYRDGSKRHLKLVGMLFDNVSTVEQSFELCIKDNLDRTQMAACVLLI